MLRVFIVGLFTFAGTLQAAPPVVTSIFPVGGQRGQTIKLTLNGTFTQWPVPVWLSDKSIVATCQPTKGQVLLKLPSTLKPGVYWLRLADDEGASNLRPLIVGILPESAEKEPNDEYTNSQPIMLNTVVNGRLDKAGDVDTYTVTLQKGEVLVASCVAHQVLRSPIDAVLQILTSDGTLLEQNHDTHGLDPQLVFTAPKDGTYRVRLFGFPATPDSSIRLFGSDVALYRLTLTKGPYPAFAWPLAVRRGEAARVQFKGWNIAPQHQILTIPNPEQSLLATHDVFPHGVPIVVEQHPCFTTGQGQAVFAPPCSITGQLASREARDVVTVQAKKGQALQIRVDSQEWGYAVTPVVRVLDDNGKTLLRAEPAALNKDVATTYTPTADSVLRVEVSDLYNQASFRSVYRLRIAPLEPDYDLTVSNDRVAVPLDKPLEWPITVNRGNGFKDDIDVTVEGLPDGFTVERLPAPAKGDGKTVLLKLTVKSGAKGGAVRVVGRVNGSPMLTRVATAPVVELETTTTELWLNPGGSVPPAKKPKK